MASLRRASLRLALGLAIVVLGLLEIQGLVQTLRSQSRLRERVVRGVRDQILGVTPRLAALMLPGGVESWTQAGEDVLRASIASEFEVFDREGRLHLARPRVSPIRHWPSDDELRAIYNGNLLVVGPVSQQYSRLLAYTSFRSGDETLVVRLSAPIPELLEDLQERRQLLVGHGIALLVLVIAGGLALFPTRPESQASPSALGAYEQAMEVLRDRGQALSRAHEAERQRMEDAIHEKEAMARAGELTAGIAHEVRNGLGTIVGYARIAERSGAGSDAAEAGLRIREECEVLEVVVRRFMDFVKRERLNLAPFDLGRMLSRVVARETRGRPGASVALPEPSTPADTVVGDEELLERAFENLVRNAREAAGEAGHVVLSVERGDGGVGVTIADDGPGLPPGSPREPRPFFTTKPGGLGLGLPLAHKIVRLHQGELTLEDGVPRGLRVTVKLPATGPEGETS